MNLHSDTDTHSDIQGSSKRLFPGCENMWSDNCVLLPAEGKHYAEIFYPVPKSSVHRGGRITGSTDLGLICRHNKFYRVFHS